MNRAVAHGRAFGPDAGLAVLDAVAGDPAAGRVAPGPGGARRPAGARRAGTGGGIARSATPPRCTRNAAERADSHPAGRGEFVTRGVLMPGRSAQRVPGRPIWIELFTPDPDAAKAFYGGLFGWTARTAARSSAATSPSSATARRSPAACRTTARRPEHLDRLPRERRRGGHRRDGQGERRPGAASTRWQVGDLGHMAVVTDPAGAAIGIWQPSEHDRIRGRGEDGAPAWFEVLSNDYDAVAAVLRERLRLGHPPDERHPGVPVLHARQGRVRRSPGSWTRRRCWPGAVVLELLRPGRRHRRRRRAGPSSSAAAS